MTSPYYEIHTSFFYLSSFEQAAPLGGHTHNCFNNSGKLNSIPTAWLNALRTVAGTAPPGPRIPVQGSQSKDFRLVSHSKKCWRISFFTLYNSVVKIETISYRKKWFNIKVDFKNRKLKKLEIISSWYLLAFSLRASLSLCQSFNLNYSESRRTRWDTCRPNCGSEHDE